MKNKTLLLLVLLACSAFITDKPVTTIFMIGDSTMANKGIEGGNPERGWGHALPALLSEDIRVDNHAQNGRSSKSFIDEGRWDAVLTKIRKGDYVFIQFGHNDEKEDAKRHTVPGRSFDDNLRKFVNETRSRGGIPVLFNSIIRRHFDENGLLIDTHGAYLESPRNVAGELNVPFIDLNKITHDLVQGLGPVESRKLFMWVELNTIPAAPKGKQDDTHLNVQGAKCVAQLALDAITEVIPGLKPYVQQSDFTVAQDGSGDFFTVQEAINAVPDFRKNKRTTIRIRKGTYKEKIIVPASKLNVTLIGDNGVTLTYDDYASKKNIFGEEKSTSGSASIYIYGPDFYAENITFENSSGPVGQAVACFVDGDRAYFKNCRFLGFQDTLYTYGKNSRQYYKNCYIEGTVDFIFGWSTALFTNCTIHSKRNGYITAPSTDKGKEYGYVFYNCKLTADPGVTEVYLSRPWRPYAQAVFIQTYMGGHIVPAGWHNWNKKEAEKTVFYAEYGSTGPGANPGARARFSRQLTNTRKYDIDSILTGTDGWNPVKHGNALVTTSR